MGNYEYIYGDYLGRYHFLSIPKIMYTDDEFKELGLLDINLYALLLDRVSLSASNHWNDEKNRVFIIFRQEEAMNMLRCSRSTIIRSFTKLEEFGLIEKKKQYLGRPDLIYVKDFMSKLRGKEKEVEPNYPSEDELLEYEIDTSDVYFDTPDVSKLDIRSVNVTPLYNNTENNHTEKNNNTSRSDYSQEFEEFWKAYPRRVEKQRAYKCFIARTKEGYSASDLTSAAKAYSAKCKKDKTDEKYIKHPATFLSSSKDFEDFIENDSKQDNEEYVRTSNGYRLDDPMARPMTDDELKALGLF